MVAKREICSSGRTWWKRFNLKAAAAPRLNARAFPQLYRFVDDLGKQTAGEVK
jgi:hypothetical protein